MIGYLFGLVGVAWMSDLSWLYPLIALGLIGLMYGVKSRCPRRLRTQIMGLGLGLLYATLWGQYQLSHRLPIQAGKVDLALVGRISSLVPHSEPPADGSGHQGWALQRFELILLESNLQQPDLRKVRLTLYDHQPLLKQGDRLEIIARLQTPHGYLNDESPDAGRRALQRGIDATGYVRELQAHQPGDVVRQRLYDKLWSSFEPSLASFLSAILLGEAGLLSATNWQVLRASATVHLVVVSGLHLGVMAIAGLLVGRALLLLSSRLVATQSHRLQSLPGICALLLVSLYVWIGGFGLALQRAWVLVSLLLVGRLLSRTPPIDLRFNAALILVTLLDPLSVVDLGFWLSFGLVWILIQLQRWRGLGGAIAQTLKVQVVLSLSLLPVLQVAISQLTLISVFSNLWAIPWISFGVMTLPILLPLALLSPLFENLLQAWVELFWKGLELNLGMGLNPPWLAPPLYLLPLALLAVVLLLVPLRLRGVGLLILLPLLLYRPVSPSGFQVKVLDVGQGQSAIIDLPDERWVYDTGPAFGSDFAVAQLTLIPELMRRPDRPITTLIISHADRDHAGGLNALLAYQRPAEILTGQPEHVAGRSCRDGLSRQFGDVQVSLGALPTASNDNDASCWLLIRTARCSLLIAGDMSNGAEQRLMQHLAPLPLTWLHLSHHGSKSSSSSAWLDYWQPDWAINSSGRNNHFGHPHTDVAQRLIARKIPLLDTAKVGSIQLSATDDGCMTESFLARGARYWH